MEERNIKLSLEKAREFYSKGGEFKDLALSAFTEEEILISKLPKTWEEFCNNYDIKCDKDSFIDKSSVIKYYLQDLKRCPKADKNVLPSSVAAEQHLALMQLHQLRDCYRQGWIPDYENHDNKYSIYRDFKDSIKITTYHSHNSFLSFQTRELAEEFLNNFRDLIVKAGDLI